METKILRDGRDGDIPKAELEVMTAFATCFAIVPALANSYSILDCFPELMTYGVLNGLVVMATAAMIWFLIASTILFFWYWHKHDRRLYLADLPEFYYEGKHAWRVRFLLAGLPFLLVSGICLHYTRSKRWGEDIEAARRIWDDMAIYAGPTFRTKAELDAFTAEQREKFAEICLEWQRCAKAARVKILPGDGKPAIEIGMTPPIKGTKFLDRAQEIFDFLRELPEVIQIQCDYINGESSARCILLYMRARAYSPEDRETYDRGDYMIAIYDRQCIVSLMRSGMSANGKVAWPTLDASRREFIHGYADNRLIPFREGARYPATEQPDILSTIIHIVNSVGTSDNSRIRTNELQQYYRPAVDYYYDPAIQGLRRYDYVEQEA